MSDSAPSWVHLSLHPLYQTVTRIRFPHQDGHATGFFYNSQDEDSTTFLVTNRHVVENSGADSVRIFTRSLNAPQERDHHGLPISGGEGSDWYSPPSGSDVDVALIPLDFELDSINPRIGIDDERSVETGSLAFNIDSILSEKSRVLAGDRSLVVGYPGHFVDNMFDFPVTRNAIVSSQYGFPYNGNPIFLTDARMHPGMSGSPVIAGTVTLITHGGIDLWGPAYKLLGVHSSTLRQPMSDTEDNRWLDLNTAWYAELIEETIQSEEDIS